MKFINVLLFFTVLLFADCKTHYRASSTEKILYKINGATLNDTTSFVDSYLKPYRDSLNKNMNVVIGEAMGDFKKEKPSGSLGNLVVDAMLIEARNSMYDIRKKDTVGNLSSKIENRLVSVAITNPGGLRIPQISKGNITIGKIFELLPFENELVIIEVKGGVLKKWMQLISDADGWPMTNNLPIKFNGKNLITTFNDTVYIENPINGEVTLNIRKNVFKDSTYYVATNDYVANGGDKCDFLVPCKKIFTGKTIRDLMIAYIISKQKIYPNNEKRNSIQ